MAQKPTIAPTKTTAKRKSITVPTQKIVDAQTTKAPIPKTPRPEEIQDHKWIEWVEYAQSRIRYLENKLEESKQKVEDLKASNKRLNDRIMAG
jgi:hypothetical protein